MTKALDFNSPEEMLEYLSKNNGHHFTCVKWYERFVTTHTWEDQASITIHWQGIVHNVSSTTELLEMEKRGIITMIKELTEVRYRPFLPVKKRKLTRQEYLNLESAKNVSEERFQQFLESVKKQQLFEEYLKNREKEENNRG